MSCIFNTAPTEPPLSLIIALKTHQSIDFELTYKLRVDLEYRFKALEWNNVQGLIGERLARSFIRSKLVPKLIEEEKWDHIVFSSNDYKRHSWTWNTKLFDYDDFREDFIVHGLYADMKLLSKYMAATGTLLRDHCTPDGLLLKMRETGRTQKLSRAQKTPRPRSKRSRRNKHRVTLPIVEGDLEVVEIKCGRSARLLNKQKQTYNKLIAKSIPIRRVNIRIVSLDLNRFLIENARIEKFI